MQEKKSYHDYVIKDGKFIGDFENMYKNCVDPWHQSSQSNKFARLGGILQMQHFNIKSVLECGCGLGYYANWIHKEIGIIPKSIDISQEAVSRAKELFPDLDFSVSDVTKDLNKYKNYDCILFAEIAWYILPNLPSLFEIMKEHFKGKYLMVVQVFYKGTQKYGNEYFTSLDEFIQYVPFELMAKCEATKESENSIETASIFLI